MPPTLLGIIDASDDRALTILSNAVRLSDRLAPALKYQCNYEFDPIRPWISRRFVGALSDPTWVHCISR
jgi:hypothetical protein